MYLALQRVSRSEVSHRRIQFPTIFLFIKRQFREFLSACEQNIVRDDFGFIGTLLIPAFQRSQKIIFRSYQILVYRDAVEGRCLGEDSDEFISKNLSSKVNNIL